MYFVVASFLGRVADELSESRYLAAVSYSAAVSPVEYGLYPVVLCLGFEGYVYRAGCFPVGEADFCLELFTRIFAENHARLKELSAVTQPREVPLYAQPLRFVVEITLQSRVGIYFQRYLEYGGEYLRIVDMEVEMEIVFCFSAVFLAGCIRAGM